MRIENPSRAKIGYNYRPGVSRTLASCDVVLEKCKTAVDKQKEAIKKQADKNGTTMSQLLRDTALESLKYN